MTDMKNLKILSCNTASFKRRKYELELLIERIHPHVIFIQETSCKYPPNLSGYHLIDNIVAEGKTRGSAVFVSDAGMFEKLDIQHNTSGMETLGVETIKNGKIILRLIGVYNSPANKLPVDEIVKLVNHQTPTIIFGDLNAKCNLDIHSNTNRNGDLLDSAAEQGDVSVVAPSEYTRYDPSNRSPSAIDIAVTSGTKVNIISRIEVLSDIGSDHRPILLFLNESIRQTSKRCRPRFDKADWIKYRNEISMEMNKAPKIEHDGSVIEECVQFITDAIQKASSDTIPRTNARNIKNDLKPKPPHVVQLIKRKQQLRKRMRRQNDYTMKPMINRLDKLIKKAMKKHEADAAARQWDTAADQSPTGFYRLARKILRPTQTTNNFPLKDETGKKIESTKAKLQIFERHYQEIFRAYERDPNNQLETMAYQYEHELVDKYSDVKVRPWPPEIDICISRSHLVHILNRVKNTSPGEDEIYYWHIKNLPCDGLDYLAILYQTCLESCYFPVKWKKGRVTLLQKPGKDHSHAKNYRPITLLPALGKIFERLIGEIIVKYTDERGIIPETQSGYRKFHSTQDQLYRLSEDASRSVVNGSVTIATCFDVEKAFDRLWKEGLSLKLQSANLPEPMIATLINYLSNRSVEIKIEDLISKPISLGTGTPQGSCLSGLIWNLWLHDIPQPDPAENVHLSQYADDIASWANASDHLTARHQLQKYNNKLVNWCEKWKLQLSASKTQVIAFTKKKKLRRNFVFQQIGTSKVVHSDKVTFLGVTFDYNMSWNSHSDMLQKKLKQRIKMFAGITGTRRYPRADSRTSLKILKSMIEPLLYYAPTATCAKPDRHFKNQDTLILRAARLSLHLPSTVTREYVVSKANLLPSNERTKTLARNYIQNENRSILVKRLSQRPPPRKAQMANASLRTPNTVIKMD